MSENQEKLQDKNFKSSSATKEVVNKTKIVKSNEEKTKSAKTPIWENKNRERNATNNKKPNDKFRPRRENFSSSQNGPKLIEKVIDIARVTKVVKGGRRFSFAAFVVVGDQKGKVGYGHGKANEVPDAIKKAVKDATNNLVSVPIYKNITIPHEVNAKFLASRVLLKPAPKGKGIIASGTVRAVVELAGYTDIYTKTYGSRSKANVVKAAVKALKSLRTPEEIAMIRSDFNTTKKA